jgi:hypothetical protein
VWSIEDGTNASDCTAARGDPQVLKFGPEILAGVPSSSYRIKAPVPLKTPRTQYLYRHCDGNGSVTW